MSKAPRILVTGGLSGIGAGVVEEYGQRCVNWSRRSGVDVCDDSSVKEATAALLAEHGAPWALLHCVGEFTEAPLLGTDPAVFQRMLDSNLRSAFLVLRHVVPAMVQAKRGRVLLFAAAGADQSTAKTRAPAYFAAKAGLVSLARSLAKEVAASGVTVNVLSPGIIRHESSHQESQDRMQSKVPAGRAGQVADLMPAIRMLLAEDAGYITGQDLAVDGGLGL